MVDHLQQAAGQALGVEGEGADHDEAEVGDRGVGDETLEVLLHRRRNRAVDDADRAEGDERRCEVHGRLGEEIDTEAQEAVGAELEHDAGQDHRARRGGVGVGVGQPGVHREQRNLHGERNGKAQEDPAGRRGGECLFLGEVDEVERHGVAGLGCGEERRGEDADEHERRPEHRVHEELGRGIGPSPVTPLADEEVHRHQHDLEEHEEGEQVEGEEHAHDPCLQHEQPGVVRLRRVLGLDRKDGEREQGGREHHQPERDAVETQCPRDAETGDPFGGVDELELVGGVLVELDHDPGGHAGNGATDEEGHLLEVLGPTVGQHEHQQRPEERGHHQGAENRERHVGRRSCEQRRHQKVVLTRNHAMRPTAPTATSAA